MVAEHTMVEIEVMGFVQMERVAVSLGGVEPRQTIVALLIRLVHCHLFPVHPANRNVVGLSNFQATQIKLARQTCGIQWVISQCIALHMVGAMIHAT